MAIINGKRIHRPWWINIVIVNDTRKTLGGGQHPLCAREHIGKQASVDLKKSLESVCVFRSSFRSLMAKKVRLANNEESHMCVPFASLLTRFSFWSFHRGYIHFFKVLCSIDIFFETKSLSISLSTLFFLLWCLVSLGNEWKKLAGKKLSSSSWSFE